MYYDQKIDIYEHDIIDCRGIKIFTHPHPSLLTPRAAGRSETEKIL